MSQHRPLPETGPKLALLATCALGLALAAPGTSHADGFRATPNVVAGIANITRATDYDTIAVTTPEAVINWNSYDSPVGGAAVDFLPQIATAEFTGTAPFTVLNRLFVFGSPPSPAQFNGTVLGRVNGAPGGNVWFYSPSGIIAGPTSSFDVGSLILTTNDIPFTTGSTGGITYSATGAIQFRGVADSTAAVEVMAGANLTMTGTNSYVALVAPRIVQSGTIRLDGSVGLIAAEQVDLTINNGLFDIAMQVGTTATDAITHDGTTGAAPASGTLTGPQKVYVAALPKNSAITVLVGGSLGTDAANAAATDGGVLISGGYDILDSSGGGFVSAGAPDLANVQIGTSRFGSDLIVRASGNVDANPGRGGAIDFIGDALLYSDISTSVRAQLDERITAARNLTIESPQNASLTLETANPDNGSGTAPATVQVGGDLSIQANGIPSGSSTFGGFALLQLDSGASAPVLNVTGNLTLDANAQGVEDPMGGGDGYGGNAQIMMSGGSINAAQIKLGAQGRGADRTAANANGGAGVGGFADFTVLGGAVNTGRIVLDVTSEGGKGTGTGTNGAADGVETGAELTVSGSDTVVNATNGVQIIADAFGNTGGAVSDVIQGGRAGITVENGALANLGSGIDAHANASTRANPLIPATAAEVRGGIVAVSVSSATLRAGNSVLSANATALNAPNSIDAPEGGRVTVSVTASDRIPFQAGTAAFSGNRSLSARATGGDSPDPFTSGSGILVESNNSVLTVANALTADTSGSIDVLGGLDSTISAGGAISMTAAYDISILHLSPSAGSSTLTGGSMAFNAGGNFLLSSGTVRATGAANVSAGQFAAIAGLLTGGTVQLQSGDIAIDSSGFVGAPGTTTLVKVANNNASRASFFGGTDNQTGYSLSNAEIARIAGNDIILEGPVVTPNSSGNVPPADVIVGDIDIASRAHDSLGHLGANGSLTIQTPGRVLVNGAVTMTGAGSANRIAIVAGSEIAVDNATGSVSLLGPANALAGIAEFSARRIIVATGPVISSLRTAGSTAQADALLGAPGPASDQGTLRAGGLRFSITDALYIQNTGAGTEFAQRRGFSAGAQGLRISTAAGFTPAIAINGRILDGTGAFATGVDAIPLVSINGIPAAYSRRTALGSTINGCEFTTSCAPRPELTGTNLTRDRIQTPTEIGSDKTLPVIRVDFGEFAGVTYEPLIDEPVTGSGNDDLWSQTCDPAKQSGCAAPNQPPSN